MIELVSFFVGLVIGVHNVEVTVSNEVSRVEFRLDGEILAEIKGEPWTTQCDFGHDLRPGEFEAVAFDAAGAELGRARQWINLPDEGADAGIVALRDAAGTISGAQLSWSSPEFDKPRRITVELDGAPVKVRRPYRIDLTKIPARKVHVLTAEFEFSPEVVIRRELVFGSEFEGVHASGLTAVAVVLDDLDELPPVPAMDGWFLSGGEPLRVVATEQADGRLIVVRDPTTVHRLAGMEPELEHRRKKARRDSDRNRSSDGFGDDVQIRVLSPEPVSPDNRVEVALLFPMSDRPVQGSKGLVAATIGTSAGSTLAGPLMLSDAVAVAGMRVAGGNQRRAVVLLLGSKREDGSRFSPEVARRYLADLHVPLFVWDLSGPAAKPPEGWGEPRPVDNADDLLRAVRRVRSQLEEQRIVWLSGRHLPQGITLSPEAQGIRLAE
jgi:hypothetical protein